MFSLFKKQKFSEEQVQRFETFGQRIGMKLKKSKLLRLGYTQAQKYGNKNPKVIVSIALSLSLLTTCLSFYRIFTTESDDKSQELLPVIDIHKIGKYDDSIRITEDKIQELLKDGQLISDSIQKILSKDKISRSESIYVAVNGRYIQEITDIIQKK